MIPMSRRPLVKCPMPKRQLLVCKMPRRSLSMCLTSKRPLSMLISFRGPLLMCTAIRRPLSMHFTSSTLLLMQNSAVESHFQSSVVGGPHHEEVALPIFQADVPDLDVRGVTFRFETSTVYLWGNRKLRRTRARPAKLCILYIVCAQKDTVTAANFTTKLTPSLNSSFVRTLCASLLTGILETIAVYRKKPDSPQSLFTIMFKDSFISVFLIFF